MKIACLIFVTALLLGGCNNASTTADPIDGLTRARMSALSSALNSGDVDKVMGNFTPDYIDNSTGEGLSFDAYRQRVADFMHS